MAFLKAEDIFLLARKGLPRSNALVYLFLSGSDVEKSIITLTACTNVHSSSMLKLREDKLELFCPLNVFILSKICESELTRVFNTKDRYY
jgi:hypothetical protein